MSVSFKPNTDHPIIVKTMQGLEDILAEELKSLGASDVEVLRRAVKAKADLRTIYKINYRSYFALRVLLPIREDSVYNEDEIYKSVQKVNWEKYIKMEQTFVVNSTVNSDSFTHSHYISLKTKDAIVDQYYKKYDQRPDVDTEDPDVIVHIHIFRNKMTLLLDSSGDSLHKRGYRTSSVDAPINEVLAAGLIKLSGWNGSKTFWDPMCGSGTFLVEALFQHFKMPPQQSYRNFAFKRWDNFSPEIWIEVVEEADELENIIEGYKVRGGDRDKKAINSAKYNLAEAGLLEHVDIELEDFYRFERDNNLYHIMMNPPYDERLKSDDIIAAYQEIGNVFKHQLAGSEAWVISGHIRALKMLGLRPSKKIAIYNGPIESKFHKFEMYEGSKKKK